MKKAVRILQKGNFTIEDQDVDIVAKLWTEVIVQEYKDLRDGHPEMTKGERQFVKTLLLVKAELQLKARAGYFQAPCSIIAAQVAAALDAQT